MHKFNKNFLIKMLLIGLTFSLPPYLGAATTADGVNDFNACKEDGQTTGCRDYATANQSKSSWKLEYVGCLNDHYKELTSACIASLTRRATANEEMVTACKTDSGKYCRGVKPSPGSEPLVDCLKAHQSELSSECSSALAAHEAMKPTR